MFNCIHFSLTFLSVLCCMEKLRENEKKSYWDLMNAVTLDPHSMPGCVCACLPLLLSNPANDLNPYFWFPRTRPLGWNNAFTHTNMQTHIYVCV